MPPPGAFRGGRIRSSLPSKEGYTGPISLPVGGKSPGLRVRDPQTSTLTPQKLPWPRPLPVATRRLRRETLSPAQRPASHLPMTASSPGPLAWLNRAVPCLRPDPVDSRTPSHLGRQSGAPVCRTSPRTSACQKEGRPELGRAGVSKKRKPG